MCSCVLEYTALKQQFPQQRAVSPRSTREAERHDHGRDPPAAIPRFRVCVQLYTHMCTRALRRDGKPILTLPAYLLQYCGLGRLR